MWKRVILAFCYLKKSTQILIPVSIRNNPTIISVLQQWNYLPPTAIRKRLLGCHRKNWAKREHSLVLCDAINSGTEFWSNWSSCSVSTIKKTGWTHSILAPGTWDDFQGSKNLNQNNIQYSKMGLYFKGRLLSSGLLCRSEVWGEVSGLWWKKRTRRGQCACWSCWLRPSTPGWEHLTASKGRELITYNKLPATRDCWLSAALRRLLE